MKMDLIYKNRKRWVEGSETHAVLVSEDQEEELDHHAEDPTEAVVLAGCRRPEGTD